MLASSGRCLVTAELRPAPAAAAAPAAARRRRAPASAAQRATALPALQPPKHQQHAPLLGLQQQQIQQRRPRIAPVAAASSGGGSSSKSTVRVACAYCFLLLPCAPVMLALPTLCPAALAKHAPCSRCCADFHAAHAADAGASGGHPSTGGGLVLCRPLGARRLHRPLCGRLADGLPGRLPGTETGGWAGGRAGGGLPLMPHSHLRDPAAFTRTASPPPSPPRPCPCPHRPSRRRTRPPLSGRSWTP